MTDTGSSTESDSFSGLNVTYLAGQIVERRKRHIAENLYKHERGWRFYVGDGGDPTEVSPFAMRRELAIERLARARADYGPAETNGEYERRLNDERRRLKYFPILFVSAPHIEDAVSGTFPGIPTPMLFASCVLDRHLRLDEFPAERVPDIVSVMNPALYTPEFVDNLIETVRRRRPRLAGISNLSEGHYFALQIAGIVKTISPETIVLMGGQHEDGTNPLAYQAAAERAKGIAPIRRAVFELDDTALDRVANMHTLANAEQREIVDFVAAGDAPYLLMEFVTLLANNLHTNIDEFKQVVLAHRARFAELPGSGHLIWHDRSTEELQHVTLSGTAIDTNELPFISVDRLTHENRFPIFNNKKTAQVMAGAGCKYSCAFCHESADHFLYGVPKIVQRTAENVALELNVRMEQGDEAVFFDDSTFTQNRRWLDEMLTLMEELKSRNGFMEWGCQTTINDVDAEMLEKMGCLGCTYIYFGVESARPSVEQVQKVRQLRIVATDDSWEDRFRRVAKWCHDAGIRVGTSLQFGLGETAEHREITMNMIGELYELGYIAPGSVALNINAPYPGTAQWFEFLRSDDKSMPDYGEKLVRHPAFETAHQFTQLPTETVNAIYRQASRILGDAILSVDFSEQ